MRHLMEEIKKINPSGIEYRMNSGFDDPHNEFSNSYIAGELVPHPESPVIEPKNTNQNTEKGNKNE